MKIVGPGFRLPQQVQRIAVVGPTGSGKTTLARSLATCLALPCAELDSLFHGPNWVPRETFLQEVTDFIAKDQWVTEWQYKVARPLLLARATTLVWLDLPTGRVQTQLWCRTFRRWATHEELWHGNREPGLRVLLSRSDNSILWWGWKHRNALRGLPLVVQEMARGAGIPQSHLDGLVIVHLRTNKQVHDWLRLQGLPMPHSA